jgi:1-acyl-sn-glycerol-3-phosphate acyltransferase
MGRMKALALPKAYLRLSAMALWLAIVFGLRLMTRPLHLWRPDWDRRWRCRCFRMWARGALWLMGVRVTVQGTPPPPPFLQVSNHMTFLDVFVLSALQGCVYISKSEVASWPVIGWMSYRLGSIFVRRERRRDTQSVNEQIVNAVAAGEGVHIFAEGGIMTTGSVEPFKSALLQPAVDAGLPVHYAAIRFRTSPPDPPAGEIVVWHRGMSFARHFLNLAKLHGVDCRITYGERPLSAPDRKQLADALCQAVREHA